MSGFADEAQLHVKGGDGGAGAVSFRREAHVARGGPDGGDGGKGGDLWLTATTNQASLIGFRDHPHRRATNGRHGGGNRRHGARGSDLVVAVPVGTVVRAKDSTLLADLAVAGDRWLAAPGGMGGRGNARFLTNRRRAPAFAEQAEAGEERWLDLELKLAADVALVGFPNAGKSTLISRISAAKPKIADYPFTTLEPHLGVVLVGRSGDETEMVVADVPGLVEGAADGRGLGHRFLRHIERARVLLVMLDLASADGRSPAEQEEILLRELRNYRPELLERPRLAVGSRADAADDPQLQAPGRRISSLTGEGISKLLFELAALVNASREDEEARAATSVVVHRPVGEGVEVVRADDGAFVVRGRAALRAVALSDLTDDDAISYAQGRLRSLGVERALVRAGIREGDTVRLGAVEFTYSVGQDVPEAAAAAVGQGSRRGRRASRRERDGRASR
ncbi:MAG: GTPase ObgE [Acidimicrobiales bacterium]